MRRRRREKNTPGNTDISSNNNNNSNNTYITTWKKRVPQKDVHAKFEMSGNGWQKAITTHNCDVQHIPRTTTTHFVVFEQTLSVWIPAAISADLRRCILNIHSVHKQSTLSSQKDSNLTSSQLANERMFSLRNVLVLFVYLRAHMRNVHTTVVVALPFRIWKSDTLRHGFCSTGVARVRVDMAMGVISDA